MTIEQTASSCDKFLSWLKRKYPLFKRGVSIRMIYRNTSFLRKQGHTANVYQYDSTYKFEIAANRPMLQVLRSVAHEWQHVRQMVNQNVPTHMVSSKKHEEEAWGFALGVLVAYQKEMGLKF